MNSSRRNDFEIAEHKAEEFSDGTILEVMPEKSTEDSSVKYILIKHDYYSSDSDHGRELLKCFISGLCNASYDSMVVYLVDKAVQMLEESNPLFDCMNKLSLKSDIVIAAVESIDNYKIDVAETSKITLQPMNTITSDIIYLPNLIVLE